MFGHRLISNQARICVWGFSANRVWLDCRFFSYFCILYFIFLHFNFNLPSGSSTVRIAYIICRSAVPDDKLCKLSVWHYCRLASYVGYPSGSSAWWIANITCRPAAGRMATAFGICVQSQLFKNVKSDRRSDCRQHYYYQIGDLIVDTTRSCRTPVIHESAEVWK